MTQNDFAFRIDRWTDDGERIVEHVAGAEDFQIAMATYHAARKRWPKAAMTLRQDRKSILRLAIYPLRMAARTPTRSLLVIIVVAEYIAQSYSAPAHSARRCRLNDTRRDLAFGQIPEDIQKISGIYRTDWWRSLVWRGRFPPWPVRGLPPRHLRHRCSIRKSVVAVLPPPSLFLRYPLMAAQTGLRHRCAIKNGVMAQIMTASFRRLP